MAELERLPAAAGIKVFMGSSTGSLLVEDDAGIAEILRRTRRRAAFHSEDEAMLRERKGLRVEGDPSSHPVWRSAEVALTCTRRLLRIARETGARIHVLHVTSADEIALLKDHKDVASVEVTPHHLTLAAPECYERLGTLCPDEPAGARRASPRRRSGRASTKASPTSWAPTTPHTRGPRRHGIYPHTPSGMTGVQTLVPIMLDHVSASRMTLERFVDMTSAGPKRLFGIARKGRIAVGYDADFTIVDLKRRETIKNQWIASKAGWTPYDGRTVTGWPVGTLVRGNLVMWDGSLEAPSLGDAIRFEETLGS